MKKINYLFVLLFLFLLISCDSSEQNSKVLYEEIEDKLEVLNESIGDFCDISINYDAYIEDDKGHQEPLLIPDQKMKIMQNPLYIETDVPNSDSTILIKQENGKLYQYTLTPNKENACIDVIKEDLPDDLGDLLIPALDEQGFNFNFNLDSEYTSISKRGNAYLITYKKLNFGDNEFMDLENLFKSLGVAIDLDLITVDVVMNIAPSLVSLSTTIHLPIEEKPSKFNLVVGMKSSFSFKEFTPIDVTQKNYSFKPQKISHVLITSQLDTYLDCTAPCFFRFELEPGNYAIESTSDHALYCLDMKLYDALEREMSVGLPLNAYHSSFEEKVFTITEKGTYYLRLSSFSTSSKYKLIKLNYKNTSSMTSSLDFSNTKGVIEGVYDFHWYCYESEVDGYLTIMNNNKEQSISLIAADSFDDLHQPFYNIHSIYDEKKFVIKKGKNYFVLCGYPDDVKEYNYDFSYKFTEE